MSVEILHRHHAIWENKPVLRILYAEWYQEIVSWLKPGRTMEVGGGTGKLAERDPDVLCTDVVRLPWLDAVVDAQYLPFVTNSLDNIVLFDTLHHIENVRLFFNEALRVLHTDGRILIMDPYISWASWPVYHFLHPEPVDFEQDPLQLIPSKMNRKPFDANQAVSTILFERSYVKFRNAYPQFRKIFHKRMAFLAYPLSGGFDHPSLLPVEFVRPLLAFERALECFGRGLAFRIFVVLEKAA